MFYLWLLLAGGTGAILRYLLSRLAINMGWTALPFGTFLANVIGSFLIGYLSWWLIHQMQATPSTQAVIISGLLGGFTTFSAFSLETVTMLHGGEILRALIYIVASVSICVLSCACGLYLAKDGM